MSVSAYAHSIGVTEADAHTARNIHLSVADCRHLRRMMDKLAEVVDHGHLVLDEGAVHWNQELREYFKGAV